MLTKKKIVSQILTNRNINNINKVKIVIERNEYKIFGTKIYLTNINWHKDYKSGFEYPVKRFDKIKISRWFDKGIDVKFPWELSRFYLAIGLAQNFSMTKDIKYYIRFKEIKID